MKSISSCHYMEKRLFTQDSTCPTISESQKKRKGDYALFSVLSNILQNIFKQKDSVLNTSVITAVTKSSIKPRSSPTANCRLHSSGERNGEQR